MNELNDNQHQMMLRLVNSGANLLVLVERNGVKSHAEPDALYLEELGLLEEVTDKQKHEECHPVAGVNIRYFTTTEHARLMFHECESCTAGRCIQ